MKHDFVITVTESNGHTWCEYVNLTALEMLEYAVEICKEREGRLLSACFESTGLEFTGYNSRG